MPESYLVDPGDASIDAYKAALEIFQMFHRRYVARGGDKYSGHSYAKLTECWTGIADWKAVGSLRASLVK